MEQEWSMWKLPFFGSQTSVELRGTGIPGAEDRQNNIAGFDQNKYSRSHVLCVGAGGLISNIAPALLRKGVGRLTVLDPDQVEVSNLNRQRFYPSDIGRNKALALARNLQRECIYKTRMTAHAVSLETAIDRRIDMTCDVVVCGVDNNPGRVAAARFFRKSGIPIIFTAVSAEADHGYVFVQGAKGACLGCLFPDIATDDSYPCPGTPAILDILQLMGSLATYSIDCVLMGRQSDWNYRSLYLWSGLSDGSALVRPREDCNIHER